MPKFFVSLYRVTLNFKTFSVLFDWKRKVKNINDGIGTVSIKASNLLAPSGALVVIMV